MQRERGTRDDAFFSRDTFDRLPGFGIFGSHRNMIPSLFGGRDPFDDPSFTRPFGSLYDSSFFGPGVNSSDKLPSEGEKGIVIHELDSDEDRDEDKGTEDEKKDKSQRQRGSSKEPLVEHPDDETGERKSHKTINRNEHNKAGQVETKSSSHSFQTCRVTYGGVNGAYYTSTRTRRNDGDGVMLEETKESDRTTGQATHRISRGIHDKGHSVTRKLNSDGKVDTLQTLHNLDELSGFEEAWKGNFKGHLPVMKNESDRFGNAGSRGSMPKSEARTLPLLEPAQNAGAMAMENKSLNNSTGRSKKVVRINIE